MLISASSASPKGTMGWVKVGTNGDIELDNNGGEWPSKSVIFIVMEDAVFIVGAIEKA